MLSIAALKATGALLQFVCVVFFGLLPLRIKHFRTNRTFLSLSNCFSGGLFIAISFVHVLPEAQRSLENLDSSKEAGEEHALPLSYVICLATFSLVLLVDKVLFNNEDIVHRRTDRSFDLNESVFAGNREIASSEENFREMVATNYKVALQMSVIHDKSVNYVDNEELPANKPKTKRDQQAPDDMKPAKDVEMSNIKQPRPTDSDGGFKEAEIANFKLQRENDSRINAQNAQQHRAEDSSARNSSNLTVYVLLLAMSIHGFFAGIAFGVARTYSSAANMFIAIIAYKWSEALTIGVSFVSAGIEPRRSACMVIFLAFVTPTGVVVGCLVSTMSAFINGLALAVSAGTFFYISCFAIIVEEFSMGKHKGAKFLAYLLGIVFVGLLGAIEG